MSHITRKARKPQRALYTPARCGAIVVGALLLIAAGWLHQVWSADGEPAAGAPTPSRHASSCSLRATRDNCSEILVGSRIWRYSLSRAKSATSETVIFDPGGPGVAGLDGRLAAFLARSPSIAAKYNVLLVEEPWVTREETAQCQTALRDLYLTARTLIHADIEGTGRVVAQRCEVGGTGSHLWGFDRESYASLVTAIAGKESLRYTGFVGQSFGSVRLSYLIGGPAAREVRWAALIRPFPVGVTADALITARAERVQKLAAELARSDGGPVPTEKPPSRSLSVNHFDEISSLIQLGYLNDIEQRMSAKGLLSGERPAVTARLSDQLWLRYGANSISPAYLAVLDELCGAVGGSTSTGETVEGVLAATLAPCGPVARSVEPIDLSDIDLCIVKSPWDTVTPSNLIEEVFQGSKGRVKWVTSMAREHGSFDGIMGCLPPAD